MRKLTVAYPTSLGYLDVTVAEARLIRMTAHVSALGAVKFVKEQYGTDLLTAKRVVDALRAMPDTEFEARVSMGHEQPTCLLTVFREAAGIED